MDKLFKPLQGGLIVSCQALEGEPLFGSHIMAKLALAAKLGGAVGIRANTPVDCAAIKAEVPELPLFGLWKVVVPGFDEVYITPRLREAVAIAEAGRGDYRHRRHASPAPRRHHGRANPSH